MAKVTAAKGGARPLSRVGDADLAAELGGGELDARLPVQVSEHVLQLRGSRRRRAAGQ